MLAQILMCIGASAAVFLTYTLLVVVRTEPWYSPQYFIPILGALLWATICTSARLPSWAAWQGAPEQLHWRQACCPFIHRGYIVENLVALAKDRNHLQPCTNCSPVLQA